MTAEKPRRTRLTVVVLSVLLGLSACSADPVTETGSTTTAAVNPYEAQRRLGVEDLLRRWADAVRSNDVVALEKTIDPAASPEFLRSEMRRAANLASVPLADWGYELVDEPEVPVPSSVATPLNAADVWAPSVVLRYAVTGPDTTPTRRPVALVLAKRDDEWRIVSDTEIAGVERTTWRGPWDFGPMIARSVSTAGGTSVVLGHPDQLLLVDRVASELPSAVDAVSDFYGDGWSRAALIFTSGSVEEFAASAGAGTAGTDVAAVSVSDSVVPGQTVTGQRVVFSPAAQDRLTDMTTRSVLRHELTHVAARAATVDGSPTWVLEGFADYSGYRGSGADFGRVAPTLSRVVTEGGAPTVFPEDSDFSAGGVRSTLAYESAWSVFAFAAAQFGEPALRSLYAQLATGPKTASEVDSGLRSVTGMSTGEFLQAWGAWVLRQSS
ncbi:hypothetical protein [Rhodococcus sovatensis]|uniref:Peptidase n=1 Tax=Rhodococcus sovatensis TaxID=1805840 RepID=A0ABZ2PMP0_9NOCA